MAGSNKMNIVLCVLVAVITILIFRPKGEGQDNAWITKHQAITQELSGTLIDFKDAELAQQQYISTGSDDYLKQFKSFVAHGDEHLFNLRDKYSGEANSERLRSLEQRLHAFYDQLRLSADARTLRGEKAAKDLMLTSRENRENQQLWKELSDMQTAELDKIAEQSKGYADTLSLMTSFYFCVIALLAFSFWFFARAKQPVLREAEEKIRVLESDLDNAKSQLERLANVDFLTEVLNLRGLSSVLSVEENRTTRAGGQLVAVIVNCDNFRRINEQFGHAVGDVVLKEIAKRIASTLRPSDHVARVGGDEFIIVLPETQLAYAMRVADRLRMAISDVPLRSANETVVITVSMGVATLPGKISSVEEVLTLTRSALKRSKMSGKNRVSLAREGAADEEEAPPARDIVEVLCDGAHFRTVFQPVIDLSTEKICGYELFTRGPDGAFESPAEFFRVCIENNVLTTVDLLCLKICIATTASAGNNLRFHINLFPSTMLDTPIDNLLALFPTERTGKTFCIEISEQHFVGDPGYLRDHVNAFKQAGILVAIDDVGFGRSSLESLILLEPDLVKVDRKYVSGVSKEPAKARLLKRVVNVAKSLGAEVVAEGIEVKDDLPILEEMGVHYGQGYYWGGLLEVLPTDAQRPTLSSDRR